MAIHTLHSKYHKKQTAPQTIKLPELAPWRHEIKPKSNNLQANIFLIFERK
jgi:hypothetical protein